MKTRTESFRLVADETPYMVKATPFTVNDETRFRVSFNGSPVHIFVWNNSLQQFRVIAEDSKTIPGKLETAISMELEKVTESQHI